MIVHIIRSLVSPCSVLEMEQQHVRFISQGTILFLLFSGFSPSRVFPTGQLGGQGAIVVSLSIIQLLLQGEAGNRSPLLQRSKQNLQQVENWFTWCYTNLTAESKTVMLEFLGKMTDSLQGQLILLCHYFLVILLLQSTWPVLFISLFKQSKTSSLFFCHYAHYDTSPC